MEGIPAWNRQTGAEVFVGCRVAFLGLLDLCIVHCVSGCLTRGKLWWNRVYGDLEGKWMRLADVRLCAWSLERWPGLMRFPLCVTLAGRLWPRQVALFVHGTWYMRRRWGEGIGVIGHSIL